MASSTKTDMVIYDREFFSGITETVQQFAEDINTNTNGAVNFVTDVMKGDFEKRSFFQLGTSLISDRDPTSTATVTSQGISQDEMSNPKQRLRLGPVETTVDSLRAIGEGSETLSFVVGEQFGAEVATEWLNRAMAGATAALTKDTTTNVDITAETGGEEFISARSLNRALYKLGDRSNRVRCWVMHSRAFEELTDGYIVDKLDTVTSMILMGGSSPSLGLNVLVTDSPALIDNTATEEKFHILGLTDDAVRMVDAEERLIEMDTVLGQENISKRIQGEMSWILRLKGWSFTGPTSPTTAELGNTANWSYVYSDVKSGAGVSLTCSQKFV